MIDLLDSVRWCGNDARFDAMVRANDAVEKFNMLTWGDCRTAGCLWGNYAAAALRRVERAPTAWGCDPYEAIAKHLSIHVWESEWLFGYYRKSYPLPGCDGRRGLKPSAKQPNLDRLKKYLAWKRRKAERIELDLTMQAADRALRKRVSVPGTVPGNALCPAG